MRGHRCLEDLCVPRGRREGGDRVLRQSWPLPLGADHTVGCTRPMSRGRWLKRQRQSSWSKGSSAAVIDRNEVSLLLLCNPFRPHIL